VTERQNPIDYARLRSEPREDYGRSWWHAAFVTMYDQNESLREALRASGKAHRTTGALIATEQIGAAGSRAYDAAYAVDKVLADAGLEGETEA
jgi:hypothetical protein